MTDGKWHLDPPDVSGIKTLKAIDFAVYGEDYIGRRVRVIGAKVFSADVGHALLHLPGSYASVDLAGVPRDLIKRLIETCGGIGSPAASCSPEITGTVRRLPSSGKLELLDPTIDWPRAPIATTRR